MFPPPCIAPATGRSMIPEIRLKRKRSARDGTPNWYEVMVAELVSWRQHLENPGKNGMRSQKNHGKTMGKWH